VYKITGQKYQNKSQNQNVGEPSIFDYEVSETSSWSIIVSRSANRISTNKTNCEGVDHECDRQTDRQTEIIAITTAASNTLQVRQKLQPQEKNNGLR